jgi:hypothetical protein
LAIGLTVHGGFGIVPSYLSERFPTEVRGAGTGFAYHAGAALGAVVPTLLGWLQTWGWTLPDAMIAGVVASGLLTATIIWLGPETRGVTLATGETHQ